MRDCYRSLHDVSVRAGTLFVLSVHMKDSPGWLTYTNSDVLEGVRSSISDILRNWVAVPHREPRQGQHVVHRDRSPVPASPATPALHVQIPGARQNGSVVAEPQRPECLTMPVLREVGVYFLLNFMCSMSLCFFSFFFVSSGSFNIVTVRT